MSQVKKAIIPAAGLGTRFLPATKTVPKEMLTIVDAPIIFYVVEEAINAGIEDIVLVQGRGKEAIEDFFDVSYELEDKLAKDGKLNLLERLFKIRDKANIISVRQKKPLGLGHAVLCGEPIVGKEPFAVLLGDEIMVENGTGPNTTSLLTNLFQESQSTTFAVMQVEKSEISKYGIADIEKIRDGYFKVKNVIEKPAQSHSQWALPGRYVFSSDILDLLRNSKVGKNNEIQLTDSINELAQQKNVFASTFSATRFDAGDKFGYLKANVELGLKNPELRADFKKYILELSEKIKKETGV